MEIWEGIPCFAQVDTLNTMGAGPLVHASVFRVVARIAVARQVSLKQIAVIVASVNLQLQHAMRGVEYCSWHQGLHEQQWHVLYTRECA